MKPWEELISLNNFADTEFVILPPARAFWDEEAQRDSWKTMLKDVPDDLFRRALENDTSGLPVTRNREGYWGEDHFAYWASGLRDYKLLHDAFGKYDLKPAAYLDFGCATGRVIRHFAANNPDMAVYGCDINRHHVEWLCQHMPSSLVAFQNHSIPTLPLPEQSLDLITAYSVFTHIEAFETAWLMEFRRLLRPGGMAWLTIHSESTWADVKAGWPLYQNVKNNPDFQAADRTKPMPRDRLVYRGAADTSYSSQVFYTTDYIRRVWGRFLKVEEIIPRHPGFQDVVVLRKV
ncbi:MAG: class I SAM-dependent methyltransferase [Hyphomonas sp.]|nr:class I SAM-dependent methyltransferase [Hyphomonas sp.]